MTAVRLTIVLSLLGLVLGAAVAISSCATKPRLPICKEWHYRIAQDGHGNGYTVLDQDDLEELRALIRGLAEGKCRLPPAGIEI